MLLWILVLIALIAAAVIAVVLFKHWKEIRLLDPDTIKSEQERQVRERIVRQRFDRRLGHALRPVQRVGRSLFNRVAESFHHMERQLAQAAGMSSTDAKTQDVPEELRTLFMEADARTRAQDWPEAERAYLEILKHDSRQLQAYRGLANLYLAQRLYPQAKETFLFLERINGCDDGCYAGLATIAESEENMVDAASFRKRAAEVSPKNAVRHGELAKFYMEHGSPDYAWASAKRASELDADNPGLLELSVQAAILVRDREEAERRYDRLRQLSDDRQKLQKLREGIDALPV